MVKTIDNYVKSDYRFANSKSEPPVVVSTPVKSRKVPSKKTSEQMSTSVPKEDDKKDFDDAKKAVLALEKGNAQTNA